MNWLTGPRGRGSRSCQRVKWQRQNRRRPRSRGAAEGAGPGLRGEQHGGDPAARPGTVKLGTAMAACSAQVGRRRGPGLPGPFSGRRLRAAARGGQTRPGLGLPSHGTRAGSPRHSRHGSWPSVLGPGPRPPSFRMPPDPWGPSPGPSGRPLPHPPPLQGRHPARGRDPRPPFPQTLRTPPRPFRARPAPTPQTRPPRRPPSQAEDRPPPSGSLGTALICRPLATPSLPSLLIPSLGPDLPPAPRLRASEPYPSLPAPQDPSPGLCKSGFLPAGLPSACWPTFHSRQPHVQGHGWGGGGWESLLRLLPVRSSSPPHTPESDSSQKPTSCSGPPNRYSEPSSGAEAPIF